MKIFKFIFYFTFFGLFFLKYDISHASASNFSTSYNVTYTVGETGLTRASFNIVLTNTSGQYYASSYKLDVGFKNLQNIRVTDPDGLITPAVTKTDNGQTIDITFNKRVVGAGNSLPFNLSFDTEDIAKKQGNIWEINIPGIANQNDFSAFNVHVSVPASFGKPTYIKPPQPHNNLVFTKEQLGNGGISIAFGKKQIFNFNLSYHLKNSNLFPIRTEIAIPPTTNYQDVYIEDITPKPLNVLEDKDGNWLAQYRLLPSQKINVIVRGKAELYLYPKKEELSEEALAEYLKEKPYWQSSNEKIKKLSQTLRTPAAIYEYVVRNLTYDFSRVTENKPRLGAVNVINNKTSAVCLEFTDLFIALARAAGIPAREVDGFAYTENSKQRPLSLVRDVLHAWPQYYDRQLQSWIMVDPTWGNTTEGVDYFNILDFDHFAFVIKGLNSEYPIPAGGNKDVNVEFGGEFDHPTSTQEINVNLPKVILSGLPIEGSLIIKNTSQSLLMGQNIAIQSQFLLPKNQVLVFPNIPPYGSVSRPISFEKTSPLTNKKAAVKIIVGSKTFDQTIKISPFFLTGWVFLGGALVVFIAIIISVFARKTGRLPFFRQQG